MNQPLILNPSNRIRQSPLVPNLQRAGAKAWSVYNGTLIAQWFGTLEDDCAHLKSAVQVWDVGGEKIVEVAGPDAALLIQMISPRDISRLDEDRCAYLPVVDRDGGMLNDPVLTRLGPDRFWLALADGDLGQYLKGLIAGAGLDVTITEPDVWILAIQGPKADALAAKVFGQGAIDLKFFRHHRVPANGIPMVLARTGWSHQGGFELHVEGSENLLPIWEQLMEAGAEFNVRPGCPNLIERIEAGLLSYGNDMSTDHTPFEAGLGRFCHLDRATACVAYDALMAKREPTRQIRPVEVAGSAVPSVSKLWSVTDRSGQPVGKLSSAVFSPGVGTNIGIAMIDQTHWTPGTRLVVQAPDGPRDMVVCEKFWGR